MTRLEIVTSALGFPTTELGVRVRGHQNRESALNRTVTERSVLKMPVTGLHSHRIIEIHPPPLFTGLCTMGEKG